MRRLVLIFFIVTACSQPDEPDNLAAQSSDAVGKTSDAAGADSKIETATTIEFVCRMGREEDNLTATYLVKGPKVLQQSNSHNDDYNWYDTCIVEHTEKLNSCSVSVSPLTITIEQDITGSGPSCRRTIKTNIDRITGKYRLDQVFENGTSS